MKLFAFIIIVVCAYFISKWYFILWESKKIGQKVAIIHSYNKHKQNGICRYSNTYLPFTNPLNLSINVNDKVVVEGISILQIKYKL